MWYDIVCVCVSLDQDLAGFGRGGGLLIYKVNLHQMMPIKNR